jgi:histidine triad (HIT) family protein
MPGIFSKIIAGEIPCWKIAESEEYFAFLDIFPAKEGHTLVVPKKEVDYIFDLDDKTYSGLMTFSKKVARAIEKAVPCKRIGIAVLGLEVPHAHIHLIPVDEPGDTDFLQPKLQLSADRFKEIAESISREFRRLDN